MGKIIWRISLLFFTLIFIANIAFYVKSLQLANEIKNLETQIEELELENAELQANILEKASLEIIEKKAKLLGFQEQVQIVNISTPKVAKLE